MIMPSSSRIALGLVLVGMLLITTSCTPPTAAVASATPDIPALETQVAVKLAATLTAKAPTSTPAPDPTMTSTATPAPDRSPSPTPTSAPGGVPVIAYAHLTQDGAANILVDHGDGQEDTVLTHFVEPRSISDLNWSRDGQTLILVSAHDYIHSRDLERNVFAMQPDGSGLRMITGNSTDPEEVSGPYLTLKGQVANALGTCMVCAEGAASPISTAEDGSFELAGVPVTARWARVVCQSGDTNLEGEVDLAIPEGATEYPPVTLAAEARGQGYTKASLSRDGMMIAAILYHWSLDDAGKRNYTYEGVLLDLNGQRLGQLAQPENTTITGLDWSPVENKLVGTLTGEQGTWLWQWDGQGNSIGALVEIPNLDQEILMATDPAFSPDGSQIAFGLRHWYWWGNNQYRTELVTVPAAGGDRQTILGTDWGTHAYNPSWSADGSVLYFEVSVATPEVEYAGLVNGDIWEASPSAAFSPRALTSDGITYLPAPNPLPQ